MRLAPLPFVILACVLSSATIAAQRDGVLFNNSRLASPKSLDEATRVAELIVLVRIVGEQDRPIVRAPGTDFRARVLEVIKGGERNVGAEIMIHRHGGFDGRGRMEERGFPLWHPGATLVAFLFWNEGQKIYYVSSGPDSSIEQDQNGKAKTFGQRASKGQHGRPFQEVLKDIKSLVRVHK